MFFLVSFLSIFAFFSATNSQKTLLGLDPGDICNTVNGVDWICRPANDCRHVNFREKRPPICGFSGQSPIICCEPPPTRISEKKCAEWGEKCSNVIRVSRQIATTISPPTDLTSEQPRNDTVLPKQFVVGGHDARSKVHPNMVNETDIPPFGIVGGDISKPKAHKQMALLGYGKSKNQVEWNCGGSLISERHILTAAHCTISNLGKPKWARMGELDLSTDKDDARPQDRNIVEWINHPDYDSQTVYNDIAIYVLDKNVEFTDWVAPACLHTTSEIPSTHATVTGFGRIDFVGDVSNTLQEVKIALIDGPECRELYGGVGDPKTPTGINTASQVCAGEKDGGKDACSGDSGGPMVIDVPGRCLKTQIGITSFGKNCGLPNTPGIYTRVSHYIDWIEKTVWPQG